MRPAVNAPPPPPPPFTRRPGRFAYGGRTAPIGQGSRLIAEVERDKTIARARAVAPRRPAALVPRSRVRERRPVAARRTSSSSATAGADPPGDDSDPEPAAPRSRLTVAPRRGAYSHGASRCPACGSPLLISGGRLICANRVCPRWAR